MPHDRRVSGFADLLFAQSAHLALARAAERAQTDVASDRPEAFSVDDRRLGFSLEATLGAAELEAFRRLLQALAKDAVSGEVSLSADSGERLVLRAGPVSDAHRLGPQASGRVDGLRNGPRDGEADGEADGEVDDSETRPTIRTEAG